MKFLLKKSGICVAILVAVPCAQLFYISIFLGFVAYFGVNSPFREHKSVKLRATVETIVQRDLVNTEGCNIWYVNPFFGKTTIDFLFKNTQFEKMVYPMVRKVEKDEIFEILEKCFTDDAWVYRILVDGEAAFVKGGSRYGYNHWEAVIFDSSGEWVPLSESHGAY